MELGSEELVFEVTFSKYCSFNSRGDVVKTYLCQKEPKFVFDRKMRVNSKGKFEVNYSFFEDALSKFWSFESPWWRANPNMGQKAPNWYFIYQKLIERLVFYVPMLIERWKSKVKITFRWIIRLWNHSLKIWSSNSMWWRHQPKIGSKKGPNLYLMY